MQGDEFSLKHSITNFQSRRVVNSPSRGVVFRLRISLGIRSSNQNGLKCSEGTYAKPIYEKTSENWPHSNVPLRTTVTIVMYLEEFFMTK